MTAITSFTGRRIVILATQVTIIGGFLLSWQLLPQVEWFSERWKFLNPFFISSPDRVFTELVDMLTGRNDTVMVWSFLWPTLYASGLGIVIGLALGMFAGLALSNSAFVASVVGPLLGALNAIPRVALVPIFIILAGPTVTASIMMAITVTFFVAFFNAYEGGRTVPSQLVENSSILGARGWQIMFHIRLPFIVAWVVAALPLAVTFALLTVVTSEILTGVSGMGRLLLIATVTANSSLTFAVIIILSVLGLLTAGLAELVKTKALHWWGAQGS